MLRKFNGQKVSTKGCLKLVSQNINSLSQYVFGFVFTEEKEIKYAFCMTSKEEKHNQYIQSYIVLMFLSLSATNTYQKHTRVNQLYFQSSENINNDTTNYVRVAE